jgi:hypothetical protein
MQKLFPLYDINKQQEKSKTGQNRAIVWKRKGQSSG